jgi:hypothetical protein
MILSHFDLLPVVLSLVSITITFLSHSGCTL